MQTPHLSTKFAVLKPKCVAYMTGCVCVCVCRKWLLMFLVCLSVPCRCPRLLVVKEEVRPERSLTMDQQVPEPVHIKEEQEELLTGQQGEHLDVLEDADVNSFQFTAVTVKSENEEEDSRSSHLHQSQTEDREAEPPASSSTTQIKTETGGEDYGESKPVRNLGMYSHLQPNSDGKASDSETEDSYNNWREPLSDTVPETNEDDSLEETRVTESGVNAVKYVETTGSDVVCNSGKKSFICLHCGKDFYLKGHYEKHMGIHTGEKPFACKLCGKGFTDRGYLKKHMRVHTGERPFACELCGKRFTLQGNLRTHMRVHTGEKPFACELCGKRFTVRVTLKRHMTPDGKKIRKQWPHRPTTFKHMCWDGCTQQLTMTSCHI